MTTHHPPQRFYDAADPSAVPNHSLAAVYVAHGSYQWPQSDVDRMAGVFGISENSDFEAARLCRCIATEPGAAVAGAVPVFLHYRSGHGHHDGLSYSDRADWEEIERDCINAGTYPYWWIAAPGLSDDEARALRSPLRHIQPVFVQNIWEGRDDRSLIVRHDTPASHFTPPHHFHATG